MQVGSLHFSEADQQYVTARMGRTPKGVVGVAARTFDDQPAIIINLPLQREADRWVPFPTLYWLIDPSMSQRIAEVERKGGIAEIEKALQADPELLHAHRMDNAFYARARWAVLNKEELQAAEREGFVDVLRDSGIGGVANHDAIKCLHAQYAFHIARHEVGTTVGKLMCQHFGLDPLK